MVEQLAFWPEYFAAHLRLSLVSLALGLSASLPLGLWVSRRRGAAPWILGAAGVVQTIPSLALLAIMVPLLALLGSLLGLGIPSIGPLPAVVALALYSMLPILRNTVTGIASLDPALIEAARAVGMTDGQRLRRVELPLALPVIVAGLRTAAVWVVGTATLSTPIGATSLGNFIFSGLQTRNFAAVSLGCASAAGLALALDGLIQWQERSLLRRSRAGALLSQAILLSLFAWAVWTSLPSQSAGERALRVGTKAFTEQYILGELVGLWIEEAQGRRALQVPSLGSTVAFDALANDQIDFYVDYSGTIWATIMGKERASNRAEVLRGVTEYLEAEHGIRLAATLGFENTYALAMRRGQAEALSLRTISDLVPHAPQLEIGADIEFFSRTEWKALRDVYALEFRVTRSMDPGLMYQAVEVGEVDVISAFSTDGRIAAYDLKVLEDDRQVIPPYDAILLASERIAREEPELLASFNRLAGRLSGERVRRANLAVDLEARSPAAVAAEWLRELEAPEK